MCSVCVGCPNWNGGEGTRDCIGCDKIESLIPAISSGMGGNVRRHEVQMAPERLERLKVPAPSVESDTESWDVISNRDRVIELAKGLSENERVVILSRLDGKSFNMIARENGLGKEHVWNLYKNATRKLRGIVMKGGSGCSIL